MIPGRGSLLSHHRIKSTRNSGIDTLRAAVIYGANASGKSNLIKSINFARNFILKGSKVEDKINLKKFKLESTSLKKPCRFEFEFKYDENNYAYGFLLEYDRVMEEWLYRITKGSEKSIFERKTLKDGNLVVQFPGIKFINTTEKQFLTFVGKGTRPNQLFLTECRQRNVKSNVKNIDPIMHTLDWFQKRLTVIFPNSKFQGLEFEFEKNENMAKIFNQFMKIFDTGIDGMELRETDFEKIKDFPKKLKNDIFSNLKENTKTIISNPIDNISYTVIKDSKGEVKTFRLMTKHKIKNTSNYSFFEIKEESDGTQRLMDLIPAVIDLFRGNKIFIIDELDRSLHPLLSQSFLDIFLDYSKDINSQLLVTTHESSLLNLKKVRKDEIWFIEKNANGESELYSLEEFKPRFDKEIRKDYLLGRFGAIPAIKQINNVEYSN
jgi:AAA15 family ATPase/GTPase